MRHRGTGVRQKYVSRHPAASTYTRMTFLLQYYFCTLRIQARFFLHTITPGKLANMRVLRESEFDLTTASCECFFFKTSVRIKNLKSSTRYICIRIYEFIPGMDTPDINIII